MNKENNNDSNEIFYIVGKNIKKYREIRGLKQSELADLCNLSIGFISDLECKTYRSISLPTMCLIAKKLNIHPKQLLDDLEEDK